MTDLALLKQDLHARIAEMGDMHIPVTEAECDALFLPFGWEVQSESREIDAAALEAILSLLAQLEAQTARADAAEAERDALRSALLVQTDLVDRLTDAVDREAEDIGGESSMSVLRLLGPHLSTCRHALNHRAAAEQRASTAFAEGMRKAADLVRDMANVADCGCKPCYGHPEREATFEACEEAIRQAASEPRQGEE